MRRTPPHWSLTGKALVFLVQMYAMVGVSKAYIERWYCYLAFELRFTDTIFAVRYWTYEPTQIIILIYKRERVVNYPL